MGKRKQLTFLLFIALMLVLPFRIQGADFSQGARDLVRLNWEQPMRQEEKEIIAYALHLQELDSQTLKQVSQTIKLTKEQVDIAIDDLNKTQKKQTTYYNSWLITVLNKPLRISLQTKDLQGFKQDILIELTPLRIDQEREMILTKVKLIQGEALDLETTIWLGQKGSEPLTILTKHSSGKAKGEHYYGLYLSVLRLPVDMIPSERSYFNLGSLQGLDDFLRPEPVYRENQVRAGLSLAEGELKPNFSADLPLNSKANFYAELELLPELNYLMGLEGRLNSELSFLGEGTNKGTKGQALRFGLKDTLRLTDKLTLSTTLLPFEVLIKESVIKTGLNFRINLTYTGKNLILAYQLENEGKDLGHEVDLSSFPSKSLAPFLNLSWEAETKGKLRLGLESRF